MLQKCNQTTAKAKCSELVCSNLTDLHKFESHRITAHYNVACVCVYVCVSVEVPGLTYSCC